MKILVFNGSPKGANSVTLQTVRYLAKKFPEHVFEAIHIGQRIKALEKDFTGMAEKIAEADIILFSYPVYTFIAPSQLHRFIELLKEHNISLEGKYVTQITTSKHFYDVTAHKYVEENVYDLKGKFIKGLSADMEDLLSEKGQNEAVSFWKYVMYCVENDFYENIPQPYTPHNNIYKATTYQQNHAKVYDVVIVADFGEEDENLKNMIADFRNIFPYETRVVNIREYPFIGGCLGCFNCASDGKCIYVDGFDSFLREKIQTADSIIYAFNVKDHSMGARFKMYDDRQFCNGHRTVTMGMPIGYIIAGDYSKENNLRTIVEARADVGHTPIAHVATDEGETLKELEKLSSKLAYALENKLALPQTFYGVGGMKIFRDLIYIMRGLMKADHEFYKEKGIYDFPQKQKGKMLFMQVVGAMANNPKLQKKMKGKMTEGMLMPYNKIIEKEEKKNKK